MSKLNPKGKNANTVERTAQRAGLSLAVSANGNVQFKKEPLQMLYETVVQTMVGNNGQLKSGSELVRLIKTHVKTAVEMGAFDFVANLAIHARTEMNVRTAPIVLVVEFAKALSDGRQQYMSQIKAIEAGGKLSDAVKVRVNRLRALSSRSNYENMRQLVCDVIQRADQITDLYAYALSVFGSKNAIPLAVKRGVADAFNKFNEYAFAKYNRNGEVKLRDVLRIVHPHATTEAQGAVFEKIMQDTLAVPYTWETQLSTNGQLPPAERKSDKQMWTELVTSGIEGWVEVSNVS